ncbi:calcium-binding protein [Plectonema cf. radiosum LEGE 06105]|uniref:Calcium-binding protein n=1 Tax=Plectonema cf. radiosum LEGE 06105 TaxID=945769 RepID=A0A8J7K1T1_9CYAN|nr:calcium-binding protein [Plectonema cf. radiosum LEGE 06105]
MGLTLDNSDVVEGDTITLTLNVDGEIPAEGVTVLVNDTNSVANQLRSLTEFDVAQIEYTGISEFPRPADGDSGIFVTITEPTATITVPILDDGVDEDDASESFTFEVIDGEAYQVDSDRGAVTLNISDAVATTPTSPTFGTISSDIIEVEGSNGLIFAGSSDDLIDASISSTGSNRIYGGSGNDTVILGSADRIIGGEGDDKFFALSGGDNIITGGAGENQFWIATAEIPQAANIITDFTLGEDVLGIAGLGIGFDDLSITGQDDNTLIAVNGSDLAILQGIGADSLSADNFAFV